MGDRMEFDFKAFLTTLTFPPLEIRNKDIAAMLQINDAAISKIRHGRSRVIPAQLRPLHMADAFAGALVKRIFEKSSSEECKNYSADLKKTFQLSEKLSQLCDEISGTPSIRLDAQQLEAFEKVLAQFFAQCYTESHANSGAHIKSIEQEKFGIIADGSKPSANLDRLLEEIEQGRFSREELEKLEAGIVSASASACGVKNAYYGTYYRPYANLLKEHLTKPFYRSSVRREEIAIDERKGRYERKIETAEHLVLPEEKVWPYFIRRILINFDCLSRDEFIDVVFEKFQGTVNGIPILEYINEHRKKSYTRLQDAIALSDVVVQGESNSYVQLELEVPLYPTQPGDHFEIETKYNSRLPFVEDFSTNYSYRLKYPCQFFAHEHVLERETALRWDIIMDVFSAFNFAGNGETANPVFQRKRRTDSLMDRDQSVILHDWVLPGSGYRRSIHRLR